MKGSLVGCVLALSLNAPQALAETPVTLENAVSPGPNERDEPTAVALSLAAFPRFRGALLAEGAAVLHLSHQLRLSLRAARPGTR
jgi:hypothetical protein